MSRPPSPSTSAPDRPAPGRTFAQVAAASNTTTPSLATPLDWLALSREQYRCRAEFQHLRGDSSHLKLQLVAVPGSEPPARILCDVSTGINRPLVPASRTKLIFDHFHGLHHAGGRSTLRDVRARFVWHRMSSDVLAWARSCPHCAASKIARHVAAPLQHRPLPDARFSSLHVDLVGPLPVSEGNRYLFTIVDRFTRWIEAVPMLSLIHI